MSRSTTAPPSIRTKIGGGGLCRGWFGEAEIKCGNGREPVEALR